MENSLVNTKRIKKRIDYGYDEFDLSLLKWLTIYESIKKARKKLDRKIIYENSRSLCGLCYKYDKCEKCIFGYSCFEKGPIFEATNSIDDWLLKPNKNTKQEALHRTLDVISNLMKLKRLNSQKGEKKKVVDNIIQVDFRGRG